MKIRYLLCLLVYLLALSGCGGAGNPAGEADASDDGTHNHRPVADSITLQVSQEFPYIEKKLSATDTDNDTLTFELLSTSSGVGYSEAYVSPHSGILYVTLNSDSEEPVNLAYHVTDGQFFSDTADITIDVSESSGKEYFLGAIQVDPETYAGFASDSLNGALCGAPGDLPSMPASIDLSINFPVPGEQSMNDCVGWALAYALKTYQEKVELGWSLNRDNHLFSPLFIYNQLNNGRDHGTYVYKGLDLIVQKGCATLSTMPYRTNDYLTQPDYQALAEAAQFKASRWYRVSSAYQIKSHLVNRIPVVGSIVVYDPLCRLSGSDSVYNTKGDKLGYHAITFVGYDDNRYGGAFKLINSWGQRWGDRGYFWIPYSFLPQVLHESYALVDGENTVSPDPHDVVPEPAHQLPNLEVVSWHTEYDPKPRGKGELQYAIINSGRATVPAGVKVNFMLSTNSNITSSDVYVVYEEIPFEIKPGMRVYRDEDNPISFNFPDRVRAGQYYMALWIDDTHEVEESDETDNISLSSKEITITNSKADLAIKSWYAAFDYGTGQCTLTYEIVNQGNTSVDTTRWRIRAILSDDQVLGDANDKVVFSEQPGIALEPGQSAVRRNRNPARFKLEKDIYGNPIPFYIYYMALQVDDQDIVDESSELNNSSFSWMPYWGGKVRSLKQSATQHFYNGKELPSSNNAPFYKKGSPGAVPDRLIDNDFDRGVEVGTQNRAHPFSKEMRSQDSAIFPVTEEIAMPFCQDE